MSDKTGAQLIAAERQRQIEKEGWTPEHDDEHEDGELALVASLFAAESASAVLLMPAPMRDHCYIDPWPDSWDEMWDARDRWDQELAEADTPQQFRDVSAARRLDLLVKAGALIAAEIDRLKRIA